MMKNIRGVISMYPEYVTKLEKVKGISQEELKELQPVEEKYKFRANEYYLDLINWKDKNDPIRKIIIPNIEELEEWGLEDASKEHSYTISKGLQHKYRDTALLLVNDVCGSFCRFCFRKRLFKNVGKEVVRTREIEQDLDYIRRHEEITNVLLTGGDPLLLSTNKLKSIIETINEIDHIKIIRIGTKTPAFNPFRIISDDTLSSFIKKITNSGKKLYFIVHFNHPRELTSASIQGINILQNSGAIIANQTPLLHGINDNPKILSTLFKKLSFNGIPPYYVFQNRPVMGNKGFTIPLEKAYSIFLESLEDISGLAKRPRFVMSHESGKIEVAALTSKNIIFRYHRSHNPDKYGKFFVFKRDSQAYWLDDYKELVEIYNYKSF